MKMVVMACRPQFIAEGDPVVVKGDSARGAFFLVTGALENENGKSVRVVDQEWLVHPQLSQWSEFGVRAVEMSEVRVRVCARVHCCPLVQRKLGLFPYGGRGGGGAGVPPP